MTVALPDDIPAVTELTEEGIRRELAVSLFAQEKLSAVQGAKLAGLDLFTFQALLRERGLPQHYTVEDFEDDLASLRKLFAQ